MSKTLTPEQYQQQFVDYYSFPGIGVEAAPEVDDEEKDDEPVRPNILTPVGQRDEQVANVFGQIPIVGTGQQISTEDPYEYIRNFDTQEKSDLNGKGFSRYLEQAAGVPGTVATVATGLPISALAYGAGQLARKQHRKNAESIASYGGNAGSMFKFQGQTVSRAPGSKIFTGNLGGLSQSDMYRTDEIRKGFIPGTMIENTSIRRGAGPQGMPGSSGLSGVTSIEGAIMDAFGTVHTGQRDDSGHMMVSASQAQALREKEFRSMARQAEVDISGLKGVNFVNAAVAYKQHVDGVMKTDSSYGGFFHKTSNLSPGQNASALDRRRGTAVDFLKDKYGITPTTKVDTSQPDDFVPSVTESRSEANRIREAERDAAFERGQAARDRMMDRLRDEGDPQETSPTEYSMSDFADDYAASYEGVTDFGFRRGGRVGMAEGDTPQGTFEPGFVEGPPENFTERETVADDQNGKVTPDTFIINAAAVEIAGSEDIRKMLMKAYEVAVQKGLDIGRVDRKLYEGTVDVALSKGEVVVPPELAKIIGYDRLRKINNRGKKEVASRQKKSGGGFLDGKKGGGEVTRPTPKPSLVERRKDEALADVELRADLEAYIKKDKLARLGWDLYSKGQIDMTGVALRNPETGREYGSSSLQGVYFPKKGQEMYPGGDEASKADTDQTVIARLARIQSGKAIRTDIPSVYYYGEKNPRPQIRKDEDGNIINTPQELSRAGVFITIAHELRHAALNYIHNEGGVKNIIGPLRMEERLMDYYDYHNRLTASKSDSSVPPVAPNPDQAGRQEFASYDHMQKELYEYYENIAAAALKGRKVPPRAKRIKKNFFEKFISDLFN